MGPTVLVIGASGSMGSLVMKEFINHRSSFGRVGVLTDPAKESKFAQLKEQGFDVILGSYTDPASYEGFEVVISLAGNAIMGDQPAMIDAAVLGGIRHFYPSEYGVDLTQAGLANVRYFRDKHDTRRHLAKKTKETPGFRYTLLLTGSFTEWAVSDFFGVDTEKHTVETYGDPDAIINNTASNDAARYLVSSILIPWKDHSNPERTFRVTGDTMSWKQLVETLGEVQGVVYQQQYFDPEIAHAKEAEARMAGDIGSEMAWSAKALAASGYSTVGSPLDNDLFDFKPETVRMTLLHLYGKK